MKSSSDSKISVKLIVGCLLTSEVKMHLNVSNAWQQAKILRQISEGYLHETHYEGKDYLAKYLPDPHLTVPQLKFIENEIRNEIRHYCPDLNVESIKIFLFPQVFVS